MAASKITGAIVGVTAFLACPCHLVVTLPLLIAAFGGSAVGAFLAANTALVAGLSTLWFVAGLALAWRLLAGPKVRDSAQACQLKRDSAAPSSPARREPVSSIH